MRITYRDVGNKEYWTRRWEDIPADSPMENAEAYPLKYADMVMSDLDGRALEAGCGAGRLLRHYHAEGRDIIGVDFIDVAVQKLRQVDSSLKVETGDITNLRFEDGSFACVLAFGLFHNLNDSLDQAVRETHRVLRPGGRVCASFRADNFQTRLSDWLAEKSSSKASIPNSERVFHKMNLTRVEFEALFRRAGFNVEQILPVENMPILYRLAIFRARTHRIFDENLARSEGYRLSSLGNLLQRFLMRVFPNQFCNIYVLVASRPG